MKKFLLVNIFLVAHATIDAGSMDDLLNNLNRLKFSLKKLSSTIDLISTLPYFRVLHSHDFKDFESDLKSFNVKLENTLKILGNKKYGSHLSQEETMDLLSIYGDPALDKHYLFVKESQKVPASRTIFDKQKEAFKSITKINDIIVNKNLSLDRSFKLLLLIMKIILETQMNETPAILNAIENSKIAQYAQEKINANFKQVNNSMNQYYKALVANPYNEQEINDSSLRMFRHLAVLSTIIYFLDPSTKDTILQSLYDSININQLKALLTNINDSINNLKAITPPTRTYLELQHIFLAVFLSKLDHDF